MALVLSSSLTSSDFEMGVNVCVKKGRLQSLQRKLVDISNKLSTKKAQNTRLQLLIKYVDCVDKLNVAINLISQEGEPAIRRLQEVVEFLSRTKAIDQFRAHQLRETLVTLKALYEIEVDSMKFDGLLDEALLNLQDEFEGILLQLKHRNIGLPAEGGGGGGGDVTEELGSEMEVEVLRKENSLSFFEEEEVP